MSIYEQNLMKLEEIRPELYEALQAWEPQGDPLTVLVGDALDGEKFLAVLDGETVIPLGSTYHPSHEANRFADQFEEKWGDSAVVLFGMGQIEVVRTLCSEDCPMNKCIVYEPSVEIFRKVLEEYDIRELIEDSKLMIFVEGLNGDRLEKLLYEEINYHNWRLHRFVSLSKYKSLFRESFQTVCTVYERMMNNYEAEMNTLIILAQVGLQNEIQALRWMMDAKALDSLQDVFPKDVPYIVVAAGPSLEKNVDVLKQAKGRAVIVAVDTALNFLLERGIVPDIACTVDARKELVHFTRQELKGMPMLISTDSNYKALELVEDFMPIYLSTTSDFIQRLFRDRGHQVDFFDGGGSVATVCFQIGVNLGFKTIILIGQDLAFTDTKAHAGMGTLTEQDLPFHLMAVDAYNGGKIMTRSDFKSYIDWYNLKIPELKEQTVINATEGGAKLNGAVQMTLQEAVDTYCKKECDVRALLDQVPTVWDSMEEKADLYWEIKDMYLFFKSLRRKLKDGIGWTQRAVFLLKRGNYQASELRAIDKKLDAITQMVAEKEGMLMLVKRMIETDITLNDDLLEADENLEQESIRLYGKMQTYLEGLLGAVEELLPTWNAVMRQINDTYGFE